MTNAKLIEVLKFYDSVIGDLFGPGLPLSSPVLVAKELSADQYDGDNISKESMMKHLRWMCRKCLDELIPSQNLDNLIKAHAWRGYIQGELRAAGVYTIRELRDHSRAAKKEPT